MNKLLLVALILALTGWGVLPLEAKSVMVPISSYNDQQQVMVDEATLTAYHDEIARFYRNSADLRRETWEKTHSFVSLLADSDTSKEEVMDLQKEIQLLKNKLQEEELSFRWDLNEKFPEMTTNRYRGCLSSATGSIGPGR